MGTWGHVWGFGTSGCESRDLGTSSMGRGDMWDGDVGTSKTGTQGMRMIITKVRGKCDISFFVKMCYLWSTLNSIFQNHLGHLWCYRKYFFIIGVSALTIVIMVRVDFHCRVKGNVWKVARKRKSRISLNFTFNLNNLHLASILFTWLKFTCVNVHSQKRVSGNQPLSTVSKHLLLGLPPKICKTK